MAICNKHTGSAFGFPFLGGLSHRFSANILPLYWYGSCIKGFDGVSTSRHPTAYCVLPSPYNQCLVTLKRYQNHLIDRDYRRPENTARGHQHVAIFTSRASRPLRPLAKPCDFIAFFSWPDHSQARSVPEEISKAYYSKSTSLETQLPSEKPAHLTPLASVPNERAETACRHLNQHEHQQPTATRPPCCGLPCKMGLLLTLTVPSRSCITHIPSNM